MRSDEGRLRLDDRSVQLDDARRRVDPELLGKVAPAGEVRVDGGRSLT